VVIDRGQGQSHNFFVSSCSRDGDAISDDRMTSYSCTCVGMLVDVDVTDATIVNTAQPGDTGTEFARVEQLRIMTGRVQYLSVVVRQLSAKTHPVYAYTRTCQIHTLIRQNALHKNP